MSLQTGPCPNCRMTNSYKSINCLECGQQLPWGAAVLAAQQQAQAAQQAAIAAQQAATRQQALTEAQTRAPSSVAGAAPATFVSPRSTTSDTSVEEPNDYSAFASSFLGERTFDNVEPGGALFIGGIASLLFIGCAGTGLYQWWERIIAPLAQLANLFTKSDLSENSATPAGSGFNSNVLLKCGLIALIFLAGMTILGTVLRIIAGRDDKGNAGDDLFITGVALVPFGLWVLVSGLLGVNHPKISSALGVFALCYSISLLHYGYTKVSHIKAAATTFGIPCLLLLNAWLCQFLITKLLN